MSYLLCFQVIQLQGDQRKNVATFLVQVIYDAIAYFVILLTVVHTSSKFGRQFLWLGWACKEREHQDSRILGNTQMLVCCHQSLEVVIYLVLSHLRHLNC